MEQFFTHYTNWEDWKNGMWSKPNNQIEQEKVAIQILSNPLGAMTRVIAEWPVSTRQNLTDVRSNRKSWLGQAACCIESGIPEQVTRSAWNNLSEDQKNNANNIAQTIIEIWEKGYLG